MPSQDELKAAIKAGEAQLRQWRNLLRQMEREAERQNSTSDDSKESNPIV